MTIEETLSQIATLRETKGKESETLRLISEVEVKLFWEKSLVYQHLVMSGVDAGQNLSKMAQAANDAHTLIAESRLSDFAGDDARFLGRVADYQQDYPAAEAHYLEAIEFYETVPSPRVYEIKSFLAANLVHQNKVAEGISLAKETFNQFQNDPLKYTDVYTWAVWQTGTYPRLVKALIDVKAEFDHAEMKSYLDQSEQILRDASQNATWGDKNFQFRLDEITQARQVL